MTHTVYSLHSLDSLHRHSGTLILWQMGVAWWLAREESNRFPLVALLAWAGQVLYCSGVEQREQNSHQHNNSPVLSRISNIAYNRELYLEI